MSLRDSQTIIYNHNRGYSDGSEREQDRAKAGGGADALCAALQLNKILPILNSYRIIEKI